MGSKSLFSIGSWILNKYRNRLLIENVEAIICSSSWKHGFLEDNYLTLIHTFCYCIFSIYCFVSMYVEDGEDINFQNVLDEGSSKVASNVINMEDEE